jgi:uncharacterized protein YjbI with pentapeptide repeats
MKEDKSRQGSQKKNVHFDQDQYEMLRRCSDAKDTKEWNKWRLENPNADIDLQGANFLGWHLKDAYLNCGLFEDKDGRSCEFKGEVYLENANLSHANLECAYLGRAHLQGAVLFVVNLKDANLRFADLKGAYLGYADMEHANLEMAHLEDAVLREANLKSAGFLQTHLEGADFSYAYLQKANFRRAIVDGATVLWQCKVNRHREGRENGTDFNGVGINNARIDPATKQLLEYNVRRWNWGEWYKEHWFLKWPARFFWWTSDYGRSTGKIITCFLGVAILFALIYWMAPNCVVVNGVVGNLKSYIYALYFSVVVMTTLGLGDIVANPASWRGQMLVMVQVILGYILLGALITRFTVLFMSGGPSGKFEEEKKEDEK